MTSDLNIYRSANELIKRYGEAANIDGLQNRFPNHNAVQIPRLHLLVSLHGREDRRIFAVLLDE